MDITLDQRTIDAIAYKAAMIVVDKLRKSVADTRQPEMVNTAEAARILCITPKRMRQIKGQYPHTKRGEGRQAQLMFLRSALIPE